MRRFLSIGVALGLLLGLAAMVAPMAPVTASPHASAPQAGNESTCSPEQNKTAYPKVMLLGEETEIVLTVKALCAAESFPIHIVLVLDSSGSMAGDKNSQLKKAVKQLITDLKLSDHPQTLMGIVKFSGAATTLCPLMNDAGRLRGCANRVDANGGTRIDVGIREGIKVLSAGRDKGSNAGDIREIMVVLSDGGNNTGCGPVLQAAGQAKSQKILLMTVCVGSDCDEQCMRQAATSPRYYFRVDNPGALVQAFQRIMAEFLNILLKRMTVTDVLPPNMALVPDSAVPPPDSGDALSGLTWTENYVPVDGITITYRVRPLETGYHPTNVLATGELVDNQNRSRDFDFPVPFVTVLQPFPLATITLPPPTPTYTPTSIVPTPPNTPVPPTDTPVPPTPTRVPQPIYLPILLKEQCDKQNHFPDVVFVMDVSTSMDRPTSSGRSKESASLEAAKKFVSIMDLLPDSQGRNAQVAVVGFNKTAWTQLPLSNNMPAIFAALDGLRKHRDQGTRLDLAFTQGEKTVLGAGHKAANEPVMIFLTDGLPNQVPPAADGKPETTVLNAAAHAKMAGVTIYTVGIGPDTDIDAALLEASASSSDKFFHEADAEELDKVYSQIAYSFGCPDHHDWSKPWN